MKAIIYAGIGLFSVATVYGVADFYSSKKKGTLDKLYVEEEAPAPKVEEKTTVALPVKNTETEAVENAGATVKAKSANKSKALIKKIRMEDFSRARIPEPVVEDLLPEKTEEKLEVVEPVKLAVKPVEKVEEVKPEPEVRKISLDKFSRAPLKKQVRPVKKTAQKG